MGMNEWPLIVFTVLAQSAVGAFVLATLVVFLAPANADDKLRFERRLLPIWLLLGAGFFFSMQHLGTPMRGMNAVLRFGRASLSNEIVFGTSFLACGGIAWLLSLFNLAAPIRKVLYGVALVLGICFLWNMTAFYLMATVPTWNTVLTPLAFATTAVLGGALLINLIFALSGTDLPMTSRMVAVLALLGVIAALLVTLMLMAYLPTIHSSAHPAGLLTPDMGLWQAARFVLLALAVFISFRFTAGRPAMLPVAFLGLVLVGAAEMIGRSVFFALHMTVGVV